MDAIDTKNSHRPKMNDSYYMILKYKEHDTIYDMGMPNNNDCNPQKTNLIMGGGLLGGLLSNNYGKSAVLGKSTNYKRVQSFQFEINKNTIKYGQQRNVSVKQI